MGSAELPTSAEDVYLQGKHIREGEICTLLRSVQVSSKHGARRSFQTSRTRLSSLTPQAIRARLKI